MNSLAPLTPWLMKYKINEIYYTIQGEGGRVGSANIFLRFAGCNLTCGFCDTEFESGKEMSAKEIAEHIFTLTPKQVPVPVIITGGEPLLQYDKDLEKALRQAGCYLIACETNGSVKPKAGIDYIACSPKVAEHVVEKNLPAKIQELRYVRHVGQAIPEPRISADHMFISPEFKGDHVDHENLRYCIDLVKRYPIWKLSIQTHKLLKIR